MPLNQGTSKAAVSENIGELESTGKYPPAQAKAIALDTARKNGANIPVKKPQAKKVMVRKK